MSVCFFVPSASGEGTSSASDAAANNENVVVDEQTAEEAAQQQLQQFWAKVNEDVRKVQPDHFKNQVLPLARIKKIMKLDEEVKMISAEAPVLFAKAAEIFIHELTLRAWTHTEDNKRRTLQRNDIAMAITKSDQFDFLIDIVPRNEVKITKIREDPPSRPTVEVPITNLPATAQQIVLQPCTQVVQNATATPSNTSLSSNNPVLLQQLAVTATPELHQAPIQLSQAQLNMIRLQMQANPNQPILLQTAQHQSTTPQIIQVTSQAQQPQQVFLAQVGTSQDDS